MSQPDETVHARSVASGTELIAQLEGWQQAIGQMADRSASAGALRLGMADRIRVVASLQLLSQRTAEAVSGLAAILGAHRGQLGNDLAASADLASEQATALAVNVGQAWGLVNAHASEWQSLCAAEVQPAARRYLPAAALRAVATANAAGPQSWPAAQVSIGQLPQVLELISDILVSMSVTCSGAARMIGCTPAADGEEAARLLDAARNRADRAHRLLLPARAVIRDLAAPEAGI